MGHLFARKDGSPDKNSPRNGLVEAGWETLIALITIAGICVGVINLATHLNETSATRSAGARGPSMEVSQLSPRGSDAAASTSHLDRAVSDDGGVHMRSGEIIP